MAGTLPKLLIICGPTATGKTQLAVHLSKLFNSILISADSRQVYKYMDIGTGKDKPEDIEILGYDLVNPNEEFSVSHYKKFAEDAITKAHKDGKLPILVGGTGFYIKALTTSKIKTIYVPKDEELREQLKDKTVEELMNKLMEIDIDKARNMNYSDAKNPRRLVRAIEIAFYNQKHSIPQSTEKENNFDMLFIGLMMQHDKLYKKIKERVTKRVENGFENEIKFLKVNGYWEGAPSRTIGYKDYPDIKKWQQEEIKYAKRQITWFKKDRRIDWFDVGEDGWEEKVERKVAEWYSSGSNAAQS